MGTKPIKYYLILLLIFGMLIGYSYDLAGGGGKDCCFDCRDYCECSVGPDKSYDRCWTEACPGSNPSCEGVGSKCCFAMKLEPE